MAAAARYSSLDIEYGRWIEEQQRQMRNLRAALMQQEAAANDVSENQLRLLVDENMRHYEQMFRLKAVAARSDVFHIVSGMWKTPVERICFMWMGGFRPSQLLKVHHSTYSSILYIYISWLPPSLQIQVHNQIHSTSLHSYPKIQSQLQVIDLNLLSQFLNLCTYVQPKTTKRYIVNEGFV
jgi:transcription factor TGA